MPCGTPLWPAATSPTRVGIGKRLDHRSLSNGIDNHNTQLFWEAVTPSRSPSLWGRCPAGQRGRAAPR
ncbi:hypothetical protein Rleg10DRAFT_5467 [Rhizobium leguminosarum bv. trifolii WSM2012]|nr:hypothetical protein Rleg10DRAFT_5467 [Rhizobium leguminosarum bv. trifolii WSM2012]